jgi:hypothetical protein
VDNEILEEDHLLWYYAVWLLWEPTFRRNVELSSPRWQESVTNAATKYYIVFLRSMLRFLVTANVVPSSPIPVTLMMKALRSSETSVLTRPTQCNIPGNGIIENYSVKNLSLCKLPLRSRYNEWLRVERQRIRSSSPSRGKSYVYHAVQLSYAQVYICLYFSLWLKQNS